MHGCSALKNVEISNEVEFSRKNPHELSKLTQEDVENMNSPIPLGETLQNLKKLL